MFVVLLIIYTSGIFFIRTLAAMDANANAKPSWLYNLIALRPHRASTFSSTHLYTTFIPISLMPFVDLTSHTLAVHLVLLTHFNKQLRAVSRAPEVPL